ncbi:hypothetical protein E2562_037175, partial [Oryza meyeriana var. granulata]
MTEPGDGEEKEERAGGHRKKKSSLFDGRRSYMQYVAMRVGKGDLPEVSPARSGVDDDGPEQGQ